MKARIVAACLVMLLQGCSPSSSIEPGVYVAPAIGGPPERFGASAGAPVWEPGGHAVVWANEDGVFRRNLNDREPRRLSGRGVVGRPAVSPDGAVIALIDRELESLVMLDARTGEMRFSIGIATRDAGHALTALPVLGGPSWSPDGSRLAFICWDGHGDEICVVGANGSGIRQLTHIQARTYPGEPPLGAFTPAVANAGPPSWSPDGTEIALAVYPEQRGAPAGVFVVDLEAGTAQRISSMLPNSEITWFADGESLLFSGGDQGRSDVLRAPLDSQPPEKLTAALVGGARDPALSPDEKHFAVSSDHDILVLDREGNIEHSMGNGLAQRLPAWSPDGQQVAFEAGHDAILNYP